MWCKNFKDRNLKAFYAYFVPLLKVTCLKLRAPFWMELQGVGATFQFWEKTPLRASDYNYRHPCF